MTTSCPVCDAPMTEFDTALVLEKYETLYHRCPDCGLVAARDTPWLEEAYESAIHDEDAGLLRRARRYQRLAGAVIGLERLKKGKFLDWAGGYGVFTQLMREKGFDFWQFDPYAKPVFARGFIDESDAPYDVITAFEVLEHLQDPRNELAGLAKRTDRFMFTTETLPSDPPPKIDAWWYYMPQVGQHITFHTTDSLGRLAKALGYEYVTNGSNWHMFHRGPLKPGTRAVMQGAGHARTLRNKLRRIG